LQKHFPEKDGKREGVAIVDFIMPLKAVQAFEQKNGREYVSSPLLPLLRAAFSSIGDQADVWGLPLLSNRLDGNKLEISLM
jgi:hypothetical protein